MLDGKAAAPDGSSENIVTSITVPREAEGYSAEGSVDQKTDMLYRNRIRYCKSIQLEVLE